MAENFRNKQWFKNLSQDRKDEICKKFDIDEKTLKKAGRETSNGRIVIDILRIDHLLHIPSEWKTQYDALKKFKMTFDEISMTDIELCQKFYKVFVSNVQFLKYKDTLHNNLLTKYAYQHAKNWYLKFIDSSSTEDEKIFYAHQVWTHVRCLIDSDLKLTKQNGKETN